MDLSSLIDEGAQAAIKPVVKGVVLGGIALGTYLLTRVAVRRGEVKIAEDAGHTMQSPKMIVLSVMSGVLALAFLAWGIAWPESLDPSGAGVAWLSMIAGCTLMFVLLAVLSVHRWSWDSERIEWQCAFRKCSIAWRDVVSAGQIREGQFAVRDKAGRKIRWSTYALEHEALTRVAQSYLARNQRAVDIVIPPRAA